MAKKLTQVSPNQSSKKNRGCSIILILLGIVGIFMFGRTLSFWGFPYFDIIHYFRPTMTFEQVQELINPLEPKGYTYPKVPDYVLNRVVDCSLIYTMPEFPRQQPLCVNVLKTNPDELSQALVGGTYDRIVLYGERSVFDAPGDIAGDETYVSNLYKAVRFMDQIAIPKYLSAYGITDVSYIKATKPYPYFYYRLSTVDESDSVCHDSATSEKVQGCARGYFSSIIPLHAIGPQLSSARPILRKTDKKRFSYLSHYPSDCYSNAVFAHETSHMLNNAGQSEIKGRVMELWFTEQVAGFFSIYSDELACGDGTVTSQKQKNKGDVVKELVAFNASFAPAALSHDYPEDSSCRQALLTAWYIYLSKGDYRENFKDFFVKQRATAPSIVDDSEFAKFLVSLDEDAFTKSLLMSKGCSF